MERPVIRGSMTALSTALAVTVSLSALAQPAPNVTQQTKSVNALPPESIIVTTTKPSDAAIKGFVEARAAPTRFLGQLAQWRRKICPRTIGLSDKYAKYVTQRMRDVATAVGAPVNSDPGCRPNIQVVFTTTPQALLDNVRKMGPVFLGYYSNSDQADELARVTHPIQAWYMTESSDYDGGAQVDRGTCMGGTTLNTLPISLGSDMQDPQGVIRLNLPCATIMHASGWRMKSGQDSGYYNVLIVAEPAKLLDYEVGSLADYITMLALSQPASLDNCQEMPSISNLLVKDCSSAANKITDADLAYLRGLYSLPRGYLLASQRDGIGYQMKKTLVTDKGGAN
jgi:hypothetical protein